MTDQRLNLIADLREARVRAGWLVNQNLLLAHVPKWRRTLVQTVLFRHLPPSWAFGLDDYLRHRQRAAIRAAIDRALDELQCSPCRWAVAPPQGVQEETMRDRAWT